MIPDKYKIKNSVKHPTSLLIGGLTRLGIEIADSLIEQGGYVIIVDTYTEENIKSLESLGKNALVSFIDYTALPHLEEEIRRLDYVFYFIREGIEPTDKISTQQFLNFSNYLDASLSLASKFDSKFLLATSIKAHQHIVMSTEMDINYGSGSKYNHAVYTEMELQRYAESLVMEYHEKVDLDTRVVRLGEIIGDSLDFAQKSAFIELALMAAMGRPLALRKDGLETEWLVHFLDAAYGIIKAQFSKNTNGQIFSICYENQISHLAIAYKIQEVEEGNQEITFINEQDNLPALKLYKPAPNLSAIGWMPRVTFDKAVKQSVVAARIFLLETRTKTSKKSSAEADNLKLFVNLSELNASNTKDIGDGGMGPITKLIEERKKQEELRKQSIELANTSIKVKRRRKNLSRSEKIQSFVWNTLIYFGNTFSFLKNRTPVEFAFMLGFFVMFLWLYFNLISPVAVIARNYWDSRDNLESISNSIENISYREITKNATELKAIYSEIASQTSKLKNVGSILGVTSQLETVEQIIVIYNKFLTGVEGIGRVLEPFYNYLDQYTNNLQSRFSTENFLSVLDAGTNFNTFFTQITENNPFLESGLEKIKEASSELARINFDFVPKFLEKEIISANNIINSFAEKSDGILSTKYIPEILGNKAPFTIAIVVMDNTRPAPVGGSLSALGTLVFQNGSISVSKLQSVTDLTFDLSTLPERYIKLLNETRFNYRTRENLKLSDLSSIYSFEKFSEAVKVVLDKNWNTKVDLVLGVNLNVLENLKELFKTMNPETVIEVNGVNILEAGVVLGLSENAGIAERDRALAQITAGFISYISKNAKTLAMPFLKTISASLEYSDAFLSSPGTDYSKYIKANSLDGTTLKNSDVFYRFAINQSENKSANAFKIPGITIASVTSIEQNLGFLNKVNVRFPDNSATQEISVCIPTLAAASSISVDGISVERVAINSSEDGKCVVAYTVGESELTFNWQVAGANLGKVSNGEILYAIGMAKPKGSITALDYKISVNPAIRVSGVLPFISLQNNSIIFTQELDKDFLIFLTLSPPSN